MPAEGPMADVAHVIQLSVAPVFLLTSLGTIMAVLSTRLGRIVDRWRVLIDRLDREPAQREGIEREMALLLRRRRLANVAISFCTGAALLVCSVIALAFVAYIFRWNVSWGVAMLFITAMAFFVCALVLFR
jgi:hypothetical protein